MPFTHLDPRLSRRAAMLLLALVLVLAGCATSSATATRSEPPATPSPTPEPSIAEHRVATDIVVAEDDAPPETAFNGSGEGRLALTVVVVSGRAEEFLALPGMLDGHYRTFSGDGGALLSLALVFDTVDHARRAYALFLKEFESEDGYGLSTDAPTAWGDEGVCDTGPVPTTLGNETICVWRSGSVLMAAGGALGAPDRLFAIAADMNARATLSALTIRISNQLAWPRRHTL